MRKRWQGAIALAVGAAILGVGTVGASARSERLTSSASPASLLSTARDELGNLAELVGIGDDEHSVAPGTLDDGKELLPQARLSVDQAVQAAQGAASGAVGEVDLEAFRGRLVFNVDVGDQDVKVDATTGEILGSVGDDERDAQFWH